MLNDNQKNQTCSDSGAQQKGKMPGNQNSGRKKEGETFIIRVRLPLKFEQPLQEKSEELGFTPNQTAKLLIIESLSRDKK